MTKKTIPLDEVFKNISTEVTEFSKKRYQLHLEKLKAYMETATIPYDDNMEKYAQWLKNTPEGKEHARNLERIRNEVDKECHWGGKREGAGRKNKEITRIAFTRRLLPETLSVLKDYAREHDINETEALEIAILKLKQA